MSYYCRLEKPGKYCIRAAHNLYWTDRDAAFAEDDPRWAETIIEVSMPDDAQAKQVVEQMLRAKEDVGRYQCVLHMEHRGVCRLRVPPISRLSPHPGENGRRHARRQAALLGIAHNSTPEAVQVLLRLLKTGNKERLKRIAAALIDRLPEPKGVNRPDRCNPLRIEVADDGVRDVRDADPRLVKPSWRGEFAVPMRQFPRESLSADDPTLIRCAAYVLEAIGVREDVPDIAAAVSRLVPVVERTEPPYYIGEVAPVREACNEATYALDAMAARGVDPKTDPQTPGDIIHFVSTVKQRNKFRPKGWEKRCQDWVRNETPYVREFAVFNAPRPLPKVLLDAYRDGARKVINTTHEQTTIHMSVQSALEFKIPVDEILGMLVDRLDSEEPQLYVHLFSCLRDLLETGKHEHAHMACRGLRTKKRWLQSRRDGSDFFRIKVKPSEMGNV